VARRNEVPISTAQLHICSVMHSGNAAPSWWWLRRFCLFSSRFHDSILLLVISKTAKALRPYDPIADSPDNIKASAYCRTASETSATYYIKANIYEVRTEIQ